MNLSWAVWLALWAASISPAAAISLVFGDLGEEVVREATVVAYCESRLDPEAKSPTNDFGLFQINRRVWRGTAPDQVWEFDLGANVVFARQLYDQRGGWGHWACKPHPTRPWTAQVFGYDGERDRWVCCKGVVTVPEEVRGEV